MAFIGFLLIGLAAGFLAGRIMKGEGLGLWGNLVTGVVGAFIGGFLFRLVGFEVVGLIGQLIVALVGAVILLWIVDQIKR